MASDPLRGVIVTHAALSAALVETVGAITGEDSALVAVTNAGLSREGLWERLAAAVGKGPTVVFVDMPAGSCVQAALTGTRECRRHSPGRVSAPMSRSWLASISQCCWTSSIIEI